MEHLAHTIMLLSATTAGSLINAIGEGIILAVTICLRLFPGARSASRFVIWTAVLFAALAFHFVPWKNGLDGSLAVKANLFHLDVRWGLAIVCMWGIFTLTRTVRLIRSAVHLRRIAADATPIVPEPACEALLRGGRRPALLCTSPEVDRPSVVRFFRPRVLLPYDILSKLTSRELGPFMSVSTNQLVAKGKERPCRCIYRDTPRRSQRLCSHITRPGYGIGCIACHPGGSQYLRYR